jgi:hypothetical protein
MIPENENLRRKHRSAWNQARDILLCSSSLCNRNLQRPTDLAFRPKIFLNQDFFLLVNQNAMIVMISHLSQGKCLRGDGQEATLHCRDLQMRKASQGQTVTPNTHMLSS